MTEAADCVDDDPVQARRRGTHRLGTVVMVSLGTGRADPRPWVQAAYLLADAAQNAAPGDKLPTQAQITTELGISPDTARRASRELTRLGLIRYVPGHGYYPGEQT